MIFVNSVPTYEYECPRCPRVFELRQRISEPALTTCDLCGGPVHRLLAAAPFILKGGGWYVTDYPSEARKKAMSGDSAAKSSAGADSKPGTASDTSSSSSGSSSTPSTGSSTGSKDSAKPSS
jgi:putative FmdB family regulatory protein